MGNFIYGSVEIRSRAKLKKRSRKAYLEKIATKLYKMKTRDEIEKFNRVFKL